VIAWDQVNTLRADIGEDDFQDVVDLFLDEMDENIARLDAAMAPDALGELLHFLKGSALNLGFRRFASRCAEYERQVRTESETAVEPAELAQIYLQSRSVFLQGLETRMDRAG
jgi:HPt (histidine-containing phosphotransfer) domain-containing protein